VGLHHALVEGDMITSRNRIRREFSLLKAYPGGRTVVVDMDESHPDLWVVEER
jgi:hypothetical protein